MNGPHDMGGMQCFGPVNPETDEPVFHANWEKRALAMTVAMGGTGMWNLDRSRHARETLPPNQYLSLSYYQIWLAGLEKLMLERGMVEPEELETGKASVPAIEVERIISGAEMPEVLRRGGPVEREAAAPSRFKAGDHVVTLNLNPKGHTRLPRYVRGKKGEVAGVHGCHVFPDDNAAGAGENPQWLYSVRFDAKELFGGDAEPGLEVMVDCFEPYLERADA